MDYNTENYSFLGCVIKNNSSSQVTNEITSSSHNDLTAWILDSGSSLHLTNSLKYITNLCNGKENIILPNGSIVNSTISGDFIGFINRNKIIYYNNMGRARFGTARE